MFLWSSPRGCTPVLGPQAEPESHDLNPPGTPALQDSSQHGPVLIQHARVGCLIFSTALECITQYFEMS